MGGLVSQALFEGLFGRGLTVDATLDGVLRQHGYDTKKLLDRYPGPVFAACVEAARAHLHGDVPVEEGLRALGRAFVGGFRQTILGAVATTALPILGPARFLPRVPGRFATVRPDASVSVEVTSPSTARLTFVDPLPLGGFFAGVIEGALRLAKAPSPQIVLVTQPGGYRLEVSW